MSLRGSIELIQAVKPERGYAVLEQEILAERVGSLGNAEKRVTATLAAWRAGPAEDRAPLLAAAQDAVWRYFVQRELCGFRRHNDVIRDLDIPPVVLNGIGAIHPPHPKAMR